jgi:hypothetical protein
VHAVSIARSASIAVSQSANGRYKKSVMIAEAAQLASLGLDADRSTLYVDLVLDTLSEAARRELRTMRKFKYEYQSDFARNYFGQGRAEGQLEGRVALVVKQLTLRFGSLTDAAMTRVKGASIDELDAIGERLLTARSLQEALLT